MTTTSADARITCEFHHDRTVNYAMQQNHVPVVKHLRLTNADSKDVGEFSVRIEAEPDFAMQWETTVSSLPAGQTIDLGIIDLQLSHAFLASLTERLVGTLTLTILRGEYQLFTLQSPIDVLAYDEWNGTQTLPEMIAAFVTPNHPEISRILRIAADALQKLTGNSSLDGYQSKDPQRVRKQLAAIYTALQVQDIAYCVPPASFEEHGQKIRTPESIREHRLGTCLDLALLFAACAEAAGLRPLIIFTQGHAFPGAWLIEESFAESLQDDITLLTKRIAPGVQEICVIEATALTAGKRCAFDEAVELGEGRLHTPDQFHFFVDIRRARASRIRPLPLRSHNQFPIDVGMDTSSSTISGINAPEDMEAPITAEVKDNTGEERTRIEQWERRLLDLSLRNPLLNFRLTGAGIPLLIPELHDIEDALADGRDFQIHPRPSDWEATPRDATVYRRRNNSDPQIQLLREEFHQHRLRADLTEKDLVYRLTQLYRAARTSLEENGANTLYMALGMLVWYETEASQKPRYAPILLLPMEIVRKSAKTGYIVREGEDEPQLNVTLMEMLRQDFGIEVEGLTPLPTDAHGVDVKKILTIIRRAVMYKERWDVLENAYLGLFSFSKFVMWHDLKARTEDLKRNKVVASLIAGSLQWTTESEGPAADQLDATYHPKDILCPISADSSQLTAICAAGEGKSIVLHGPPGTGKSQTITNIIVHTLAQGKSVLFVAEKMAALTVVQRRLAQIGMAPFCLEVHSNKSKKKDVLEQLRAAREIGRIANPQNWQQEADRLATLRNELNGYVNALHRKRGIGHSLFYGLARLTAVRKAPAVVFFDTAVVANLSPERLRTWTDLAHQLRIAGEGCGHPHGNIWSGSHRKEYIPQLRNQVAEGLSALRHAVEQWHKTVSPISVFFNVSGQEGSYRDLSALLELAKHFLAMPTMPSAMVQAAEWDEVRVAVEDWITHGRIRDNLRHEMFSRYTDRVMQLDISGLHESLCQADRQWFLPRLLGRYRVSKALRSTLKPGIQLASDQLKDEMTRLQSLREEERVLSSASDRAREILGRLWHEGNADWDMVADACQWTDEVRKLAAIIAGTDLARMEALRGHWARMMTEYHNQLGLENAIGQQLRAFTVGGNAVLSTWHKLSQLLVLDQSILVDDQQAPGWFSSILARVSQWEGGLDGLRDWCAWIRIREQAIESGLMPFVAPYENGQLTHVDIEPAFVRGLYQAWVEQEIARDQALSSFSRVLFEDKIRQFRELDETFAQLTCQEVYARLAARVPYAQGDAAQNSEMGILGRELGKQKKHLALRALFQKIPNVLSRLKPCMLMSPISVAQYLDPAHPPFDLVIFDEASQVPTCDAAGAIARGKEVIIVGDPNQLPPTSFFTTINTEDDDESLYTQDLESILDDCLAIQMPQEHLRWHYRSQHESLIAFSNYQYYDNGFLTFPSTDDLTPMVRWIPVDGVYDRGKSRQNRAEADAVVAEIVRRLRDPELCQRSIGVVTFSQAQQQLIEDLLDKQLSQEPDLERFFSLDNVEPVFVKNLENVQGDERDIILFSIGYGPDALGHVSINFGPLNKEGGSRRLNVAVSRARREMLVFSTLRADQLDTSRTSAKGVADLKAFLQYAEHGKHALYAQRTAMANAEHDSIFEEQVCQALRERGHTVHIQVGCSGYRLDLAVVDPDHPGRYFLGIECDGATYHRAKTARDRDKLRDTVLRRLGWQIHRIWSTDWWENPQHEIDRIEEALAAARQHSSVASYPATAVSPVSEAPPLANVSHAITPPSSKAKAYTPVTAAIPYTIWQLSRVTRTLDDFYLPSTTWMIAKQITEVANAEGPISYSLLCRRIVQAWGMSKVGSRIDARIREASTGVQLRTTQCGTVTYYWPETIDPAQYRTFRVSGDDKQTRRDAEDISPEEVANAALEVLRKQISLPEADLIHEVAHLFGFQRTGASVEQHLRHGIARLLQSGNASRGAEGHIVHVE